MTKKNSFFFFAFAVVAKQWKSVCFMRNYSLAERGREKQNVWFECLVIAK